VTIYHWEWRRWGYGKTVAWRANDQHLRGIDSQRRFSL